MSFYLLARSSVMFSQKIFMILLFKVTKRQWPRFGLSYAVIHIIKLIFVFKLRLHEGRRSLTIIWLCLWFFSIYFGEISQNFHNLWNLSRWSLKYWKKSEAQRQFPRYLQYCVFFLYLKFGVLNFFNQQALRRAHICLTVQQILGNFTDRHAINLAGKIPIFFVAKHFVME